MLTVKKKKSLLLFVIRMSITIKVVLVGQLLPILQQHRPVDNLLPPRELQPRQRPLPHEIHGHRIGVFISRAPVNSGQQPSLDSHKQANGREVLADETRVHLLLVVVASRRRSI